MASLMTPYLTSHRSPEQANAVWGDMLQGNTV
jgi:hypothetical protein